MNGYERRTEQKKNKIRYAAVELFSLYGSDKTSVSDIAKKAGVAPATVYNYFGTKEDLVKNTLIYFIDKNWTSLKALLDSDLSFPNLVEHIIFTRDELANQINLDLLNKLINTNTDPEMKQYIDDFYDHRFPDAILQFIKKGREEGYIHKDFSNEAVMLYLQTYRDMAHRSDLMKNNNKDLLKELYNLILYGLAGQPSNRSLK